MYGDFSRDTFVAGKHRSRVLLLQGRVLLDADLNEQTAILLHYLQSLTVDLIGPYAGTGDDSFKIDPTKENGRITNYNIGPGHYYVDGILCENDLVLDSKRQPIPLTFANQDNYPPTDGDNKDIDLPSPPSLVYLDVWERSVSSIEDPMIREVALGGADTAARAKVVWRVKIWSKADRKDNQPEFPDNAAAIDQTWWTNTWIPFLQPTNRGMLTARSKQEAVNTDPCITHPEARYRGNENQLYRVEIHTPGPAGNATFKWSRDNGAVVFPIRQLADTTVTLDNLSRDSVMDLHIDDWVELIADDITLQGSANKLWQVASTIDPVTMTLTLKGPKAVTQSLSYDKDSPNHPFLRRWDHKAGAAKSGGLTINPQDGAATLKEATWYTLEDGIQIQFQKADAEPQHQYRTGDYWLIPARTATGDVEWAGGPDNPLPQPPHGVEHHYAPLAFVPDPNTEPTSLRRTIKHALNES